MTTPIKDLLWDIITYIPKLVLIVAVVFLTRVVLRVIRYFFLEVERGSIRLKQFHSDWAMPTYQIVRVFVLIFAFIIIFPNLPASGSDSFKGISVFIGVLVSFGSSTAIGNIVAGIVLTYMRPFKVNDFVMIDNVTGKVIEKTLLMTRLLTQKNEEVTIPNLKILSHHLVNYSSVANHQGVIFHTSVSLSYKESLDQVTEVLLSAAKNTARIEANPKPFVLQSKLDDFYIVHELNAYTKSPENMLEIYSDLRKNILNGLQEAKIETIAPVYFSRKDAPVPQH